ncbi:hypothetical protein K505DRAFT_322818 [Melanomma pulvis-pyrius CBS 109.77]|uniref:AN1-type domain-containing protein n=1 Tax=Melanomma pulvis-pyrius CBS 109.77 TaxID=1314802 RepID=A0A6A6XKN5_9PLEO|nr:hypothetical protein K505DRAFT_322818 [Melanomma pulvis-pyrius CBS 109.77]
MAASRAPAASTPSAAASFTNMKGDLDAIGAHCQMEYCHILDLLPFYCDSCGGAFCLDHRTKQAHKCSKVGDEVAKPVEDDSSNPNPNPKPSLYNHDQQCFEPSCKILIDTARMPINHCTTCNRDYCLKHRMEEDHNCKNLKPPGARPKTMIQEQREYGMSAIAKLRSWSANKMAEDSKKKKSMFGISLGRSSKSAAAEELVKVNQLKKTAKGDASIPQNKRVYLNVEASADTTKAKVPTGKFFYNKEWTVGRVLDVAAKALQVENVNNRGEDEEDKLRVFHLQGGRLLKFSEKIGAPCANGNTIVLLRGVGAGDPDLIDL